MNKVITFLVSLALSLSAFTPTLALESTVSAKVNADLAVSLQEEKKAAQEERKEAQEKLKEERKENENKFKEERKTVQAEFKAKLQVLKEDLAEKTKKLRQDFAKRSLTLNGELTLIGGTSLPTTLTLRVKKVAPKFNSAWESVSSTYPQMERLITIQVTKDTKFVRRYWGKSALDELTVGDSLHVVGSLQPDGTFAARTVKDDSIHVTHSVHKGYIQSLDATNQTFVMNRANTTATATAFTVKVSSLTKLTVPGIEKPTFNDLKTTSRVAVYGIINNRTRTIDARQVRVLERDPIRMQVNINGELMSMSGTSLPAMLVVKATKVSPGNKYPELASVYPAASKEVTIKVTDDSVIVQQFWGKSNLGEFSIGNKLHIIGRLQEDGSLTANLVQNTSIPVPTSTDSST